MPSYSKFEASLVSGAPSSPPHPLFRTRSPEPGVAHLKTATEAYAAQQEVVTEAIQRLSKVSPPPTWHVHPTV